jgi:hypothetical protein
MRRYIVIALLFTACGGSNLKKLLDGGQNDGGITNNVIAVSLGACGQQLSDGSGFCETFDSPHPTTGRSGQLDGVLWGVSRIGGNNIGQHAYDEWKLATIDACGSLQPSSPDGSDVLICGGQLREAVNDAHTYVALAMYPRQPFDFAGRTGTISFDVTNDTFGSHDAWPELWITDQPVPAPNAHFLPCDTCSLPRNSVGIRFSAAFTPNQGGQVQNCPNDNNNRWTVDSIVTTSNYAQTEYRIANSQAIGCVIAASGPNGPMNHIEVQISQNQVDVYATDPGSSTLVHLSSTSVAVPLTRGVVWIEDTHYNAAKDGQPLLPNGDGVHTNHTFAWDNLAFDGPVLPRDVALDVLDSFTTASDGLTNLGWSTPIDLVTLPVTADQLAAAPDGALLMFTYSYDTVNTFNYVVNGHAFSMPGPPNTGFSMNKSIALPIPPDALVPGPQQISISADIQIVVANVDIAILGAGEGGAPMPDAGPPVDAGPPDAGPPDAGLSLPPAPTGLACNPQIVVSWNPVAVATSYNVYRSDSKKGPFLVIANVPTPPFNDQSIMLGTTYLYMISALNVVGEGPQSTSITASLTCGP